jgi:hypothetical protein
VNGKALTPTPNRGGGSDVKVPVQAAGSTRVTIDRA